MLRSPRLVLLLVLALVPAACGPAPAPEPAVRYPVSGQVLAVDAEARALTVKHGDIEGLMPAMTMTFPVADDVDLSERAAGDLISGTLEVVESQARLLDVVSTGTADLPTGSNEVALAAGVLDVGDEAPDAALIDQTDRRRSLAEWRGTPTLFSFVYTTCPLPNFCPLIDRHFAALQTRIADDEELAGRVRLVSISIDPAHDTPDILAAHAAALGADPAVWTFLTGDLATVDRVAGRYGVGIVRPDSQSEIKHNLRTTLVGADNHVREIYTGNEWTPDDILDDLRAAVAAR